MTPLLVGIGGLGCPAAIVLARAGLRLGIADDDIVEIDNLHRQILFDDESIGRSKVEEAARILAKRFGSEVIPEARMVPENAIAMVKRYDVVLEGSDNFATKFLVADACRIAGVPVVHGAAVRWNGTALAIGKSGPCYRCLFEDIPFEHAATCAEAGVVGPVVGTIGAVMADLALGLPESASTLVTYDGKTDRLRARRIERRPDCDLCNGRISDVQISRYTPA